MPYHLPEVDLFSGAPGSSLLASSEPLWHIRWSAAGQERNEVIQGSISNDNRLSYVRSSFVTTWSSAYQDRVDRVFMARGLMILYQLWGAENFIIITNMNDSTEVQQSPESWWYLSSPRQTSRPISPGTERWRREESGAPPDSWPAEDNRYYYPNHPPP